MIKSFFTLFLLYEPYELATPINLIICDIFENNFLTI